MVKENKKLKKEKPDLGPGFKKFKSIIIGLIIFVVILGFSLGFLLYFNILK